MTANEQLAIELAALTLGHELRQVVVGGVQRCNVVLQGLAGPRLGNTGSAWGLGLDAADA